MAGRGRGVAEDLCIDPTGSTYAWDVPIHQAGTLAVMAMAAAVRSPHVSEPSGTSGPLFQIHSDPSREYAQMSRTLQ